MKRPKRRPSENSSTLWTSATPAPISQRRSPGGSAGGTVYVDGAYILSLKPTTSEGGDELCIVPAGPRKHMDSRTIRGGRVAIHRGDSNAGSSSIKFALYDAARDETSLFRGQIGRDWGVAPRVECRRRRGRNRRGRAPSRLKALTMTPPCARSSPSGPIFCEENLFPGSARSCVRPARSQAEVTATTVEVAGQIFTIELALRKFWNGGNWSLIVCPGCGRRANVLRVLRGKLACWRCCATKGVRHRSEPMSVRQRAERSVERLTRNLFCRSNPSQAHLGDDGEAQAP